VALNQSSQDVRAAYKPTELMGYCCFGDNDDDDGGSHFGSSGSIYC
jgi:hypothetical protein